MRVISVLADLAGRVAFHRDRLGASQPGTRDRIPAALREALVTEERVQSLARAWGGAGSGLLGGGPSAVTAEEVALKTETSYLQAEGMSTETMLHGPSSASSPTTSSSS